MPNKFTLLLIILTIISGLFWFIEKLFSFLKYYLNNSSSCKIRSNRVKNDKENHILKYKSTIFYLMNKLDWIKKCSYFFPILLPIFLVRSFLFEPFKIPSGSMMPTLLIGDFIFVKKFTYGIRNPINQSLLIEVGHPKRGDLVVFKYPLNPKINYIKRVIGLPGDKIIYNPISKRIIIQSNCYNKNNCNNFIPVNYGDFILSDFVQTTKMTDNNKIINQFFKIPLNKQIDNNSVRLIQCKEYLDEKTNYDILILPEQYDQLNMYYHQPNVALAEWMIPEGQYFMMGDNRDNSFDSRYWGLVPEKNLIGKAVIIWMSLEKMEKGWPTGIRLNRIGIIK